MYYIITSQKKKKVLATKSFISARDFIVKNKDSKIRQVDYNAKLKIMDKRVFLKLYYEATEDKNDFFQLAELMVKGSTNLRELINLLELRQDYREYKNNINKTI